MRTIPHIPNHLVRGFLVGLALLAALAWSPGHALAAGTDQPLTLRAAINQALSYSPTMEQARQALSKAQSAESEAFTYFLPTLETSYGWQRVQDPTEVHTPLGTFKTGSENTYQWSTSVEQPIFTGFRLSGNYRLAELGIDVQRTNLRLAMLNVVLSVKEAYYNHLSALKSLEVANQSVKLLESQRKTSKDFYDVGILPINDVLKVEVELANARQNQVSAENQVQLTRSRLNVLLGRAVDAPLTLADDLEYEQVNLDFTKAKLKARANRPELRALDLQLKQSDQAIRVARSDYWPQLGLTGSYDFTSDSPELGDSEYYDATSWTVAAELSWSLWSWGRTGDKVNQARADKLSLKAARKDLRDQVDLQVKEACLVVENAAKNIVTSKAAIKQAEENYRITQERYSEQLTTNTELLDAQTLLTQARNNYYTALSFYNIALARLSRAMGQGMPKPPPQDEPMPAGAGG